MKANVTMDWLKTCLVAGGLGLAACSTGCQVSVGGQTLPSPYYIHDDVQYFPPGPEFKLQREASAMQRYNAEQQLDTP